jgi:hypothetical protein
MARRLVPLTIALVLGITPMLVVGSGATAREAGRGNAPSRVVDLPDGWQPEGVTTGRGGRVVYSGSLADGSIARVNTRTGQVLELPESSVGKPSVGLDYDRKRRILWVAGGPEGEIRAVELGTGAVLATYTAPASTNPAGRFINDVVVTSGAVYATDSFNQELVVVELPASLSIPPSGPTTLLPLTGDLVFRDGFNTNGIVETANNWLVLVQSNTGRLFRVNATSGKSRQIDLEGKRVRNGDGLELRGAILYVVRNQNNRVDVFEINKNAKAGERVKVLRSDDFDIPTTATVARGGLWVANARFGVPEAETPTAPYWLTRVPAFRG